MQHQRTDTCVFLFLIAFLHLATNEGRCDEFLQPQTLAANISYAAEIKELRQLFDAQQVEIAALQEQQFGGGEWDDCSGVCPGWFA